MLLVLRAYIKLIQFQTYLGLGRFQALRNAVLKQRMGTKVSFNNNVGEICAAVDIACICCWKQVLCLQRSGVTVCLLKQHGIDAKMVIGAQQLPFRAHAWVEVNGLVVNDKPYVREIYAVLDQW